MRLGQPKVSGNWTSPTVHSSAPRIGWALWSRKPCFAAEHPIKTSSKSRTSQEYWACIFSLAFAQVEQKERDTHTHINIIIYILYISWISKASRASVYRSWRGGTYTYPKRPRIQNICKTHMKHTHLHWWNIWDEYVKRMCCASENICEPYVKHTWNICETHVTH